MSRTARYESLNLMDDKPIHVIGVGAIGRQVAVTLAIMGWPGEVHIYDFDTVEEVNLGTQGFMPKWLGSPKVEATLQDVRDINPECQLHIHNGRIGMNVVRNMEGVVFCCVDSMETRQQVFQNLNSFGPESVDLFLDARMSSEVFDIWAAYDEATKEQYNEGWFPDSEANQDTCTARSTYYCANVAAGFMIAQLTKHTRGIPLESNVRLDMTGMGTTVHYAPVPT